MTVPITIENVPFCNSAFAIPCERGMQVPTPSREPVLALLEIVHGPTSPVKALRESSMAWQHEEASAFPKQPELFRKNHGRNHHTERYCLITR